MVFKDIRFKHELFFSYFERKELITQEIKSLTLFPFSIIAQTPNKDRYSMRILVFMLPVIRLRGYKEIFL